MHYSTNNPVYLLEVYCFFGNIMYTVSKVFPIRDANNITPTSMSATNRPVLDNVDELSKIGAVNVSRGRDGLIRIP